MRILKAVVGWASLIALLVFVFMNTQRVEVRFFNATLSAALGLFIVAAALLGAVGAPVFKGVWAWTRRADAMRPSNRAKRALQLTLRLVAVGVLLVFVFMNLQMIEIALPTVMVRAPIGYILLLAALAGGFGRTALVTLFSWTRPRPRTRPEPGTQPGVYPPRREP